MDKLQQVASLGKMVVVEGIEGAGKSTVMNCIHQYLDKQGRDLLVTREPGGTAVGERLRDILKSTDTPPVQPLSELLLLYASRQELMAQVIEPALSSGRWVLSDRFELSTYAYQGAGRGMPASQIAQLSSWCLEGFRPNLTFYLDISYEVSVQRLELRGSQKDRFEQAGRAFFDKVRHYYRQQAQQCDDICLIDAEKPLPEVCSLIEQKLKAMCG